MPKKSSKKNTVLVTRPRHQSEAFLTLLEQYGMNGVSFPAIDIAENTIDDNAKETLKNLDQYNFAIFISVNSVEFGLKVLKSHKLEFPDNLLVATIGPATAEKLDQHGISVDIVPDEDFNTEGLLNCPEMYDLDGEKIVIFRGEAGREILGKKLEARGAEVVYIDCYKRVVPDIDVTDVEKQISKGNIAAVTVTSVSSVSNLFSMLNKSKEALTQVLFIAASNRIADECEKIGCINVEVAENSGDKAMLRMLTILLEASNSEQEINN